MLAPAWAGALNHKRLKTRGLCVPQAFFAVSRRFSGVDARRGEVERSALASSRQKAGGWQWQIGPAPLDLERGSQGLDCFKNVRANGKNERWRRPSV
jgi:hypothetical protein